MSAVLKLGELFSGPGGMGFGALSAQVELSDGTTLRFAHGWATDRDKDSCETYRHNIAGDCQGTVICRDVRDLELASLPPIDCLAFGFPCNDFSVVGEQRGTDGVFGGLYKYGVEALRIHQPLCFVAENVGGLRNANDGDAFNMILRDLHQAGYNVYPHLYKFEEYGVPQARHRILIVGIRSDFDVAFRPPAPNGLRKTARQALEIPPIPRDATNQELTRQSEQVVERLKHIRPGENAFTADLPEELRLNVVGAKISQIYRRLHPDKPAYTITGSGGGGTHVYHWSENRALTNRERARLQTFPDSFEFKGSKESVRKQIGMAVPCEGARIVFEALLLTLASRKYACVDCNLPSLTKFRYDNRQELNEQDQMRLFERLSSYSIV